jgi:hypothetical protein
MTNTLLTTALAVVLACQIGWTVVHALVSRNNRTTGDSSDPPAVIAHAKEGRFQPDCKP